MNMNHVKAPEYLKTKTISVMKEQQRHPYPQKYRRKVLIAACIPILFTLTAFSYQLFSGIDGDELSLNADYKGNGIVEIAVENHAQKPLHFDETIKLQQWSTNEDILQIQQEMPVVEPGQSAVITIDIPDEYVDELEVPLLDTDWHYFQLTTNHFMFGQTWTASLRFAEAIPTVQEELPPTSEIPVEDHTNQDAVSAIKDHFEYQNPLSKTEISFDYNDYKADGEYVHPELDLVEELGADIYPFSSGTVTETGFDADRGHYIIIDHGDGLVSSYTHCNEIFKKQNDVVTMDDVIATVGKSGMATGAHLGFSITLNDVPINPESLLSE